MLSLVVASAAVRAHDHAALDSALDASRAARLALQSAVARSAHADSVAAAAVAGSHVAAEREQRAVLHADSTGRVLAVLRERYRAVSAAAPDTCLSIVAAADSALAAGDSVRASLDAALHAADDRAAFLQVALDTTRDASAKLRAASVQSAFATAQLERDAKPPVLSRFLKAAAPRVGVGLAAGLDISGRPNLVTGITIGWSW